MLQRTTALSDYVKGKINLYNSFKYTERRLHIAVEAGTIKKATLAVDAAVKEVTSKQRKR